MSSEVRLHDASSVEALLSGISETSKPGNFSRDHLLRVLAYLEGELQAKDIALNALKAERAKSALYQAKYGRLGANDPFLALQRDSVVCAEELDEAAVSNMYESQLSQLEKLISVQRKCQSKSKQALIAAERRHARVIRELEKEKQRSVADAAHGDDLCALLDNERTKLKQQLEYQDKQCKKLKKDLALEAQKLVVEKEKHKKIVLFLINERKQILLKMHELRLKNQSNLYGPPEGGLVDELRKEILSLREERDHLTAQMKHMSMENTGLKEVIRTQEEDLTLIRQNILSNTRQHTESLARVTDDCAIIANKGASTSGIPSHFMPKTSASVPIESKIRLSNSSSFPSSIRSRISSAGVPSSRGTLANPSTRTQATSLITSANVRAQSSTSTMRPSGIQSSAMQSGKVSSNPSSPIKKIPTPTTAQLSNRKPQAVPVRAVGSAKPQHYVKDPEIEQLGAVIESMGAGASAPARSPMVTKRSASLPRHSADNSPSGLPKSVSITKAAPGSSTLSQKNGLLKGFGVGRSLADKSRANS